MMGDLIILGTTIAGVVLMVWLVKRWTGASWREILFRW